MDGHVANGLFTRNANSMKLCVIFSTKRDYRFEPNCEAMMSRMWFCKQILGFNRWNYLVYVPRILHTCGPCYGLWFDFTHILQAYFTDVGQPADCPSASEASPRYTGRYFNELAEVDTITTEQNKTEQYKNISKVNALYIFLNMLHCTILWS